MNAADHSYELSLIQGLALCRGKCDPILHDHYKALVNETARELRKLPGLTRAQVDRGIRITQQFEKATGWNGKPRHMMSLISFCCEMIEHSRFRYPRSLLHAIWEIVDWYEQHDGLKVLCFTAGEVAYQKWLKVTALGILTVVKQNPVSVKVPALPRKKFDPGRICIDLGRIAQL
jgi:hypothetical protein